MSKNQRRRSDPRISDERDEDSELIDPPLSLLALFVVPLLLLMIWAFAQG